MMDYCATAMFEFFSWARVEMYGITWLYKYSNFINSCPRSNPTIHGFVKKKCRIHFMDSCFFPMAHMYPYVLHLILDPLFVDLRFGVPGVGDYEWRAAI